MLEILKGKDGKEYQLSPTEFGDLIALATSLQWQSWRQFQSIKGTIPDDVFESTSERIYKECLARHVEPFSENNVEYSKSLEGKMYLVFLSLKRNHPEMTYAKMIEIFDNKVAEQLTAMSSGTVTEDDQRGPSKKKGVRARSTKSTNIS